DPKRKDSPAITRARIVALVGGWSESLVVHKNVASLDREIPRSELLVLTATTSSRDGALHSGNSWPWMIEGRRLEGNRVVCPFNWQQGVQPIVIAVDAET